MEQLATSPEKIRSVTVTDPMAVAEITRQLAQLEAFIKGDVQNAVGARVHYYQALCAVAGHKVSDWIGVDGVAINTSADTNALNFARSVRLLDMRQAVIVPWQSSDSTRIRFAVARRDVSAVGLSGLWTVLAVSGAVVLFLVSPGAALVGAGIYFADAYLSYAQVQAEADAALARTKEKLSDALARAQRSGNQTEAAAITTAIASADRAAADGSPSWMDSILGTLKTAAAGAVGGGAAAIVILALALSSPRRAH